MWLSTDVEVDVAMLPKPKPGAFIECQDVPKIQWKHGTVLLDPETLFNFILKPSGVWTHKPAYGKEFEFDYFTKALFKNSKLLVVKAPN